MLFKTTTLNNSNSNRFKVYNKFLYTFQQNKQNNKMGWLLTGFATLLSQGIHVVSGDIGASGRLIKGATSALSKNNFHPRAFINTQTIWRQWTRMLSLILELKNYHVTLFALTDPIIKPYAHAVAWSTWIGSQTAWKCYTLLSIHPSWDFIYRQHNSCILNLENTNSRLNNQNTKHHIPSFGVNTAPLFDSAWVGITSVRQHPTLQYTVLSFAFKHLGAHSEILWCLQFFYTRLSA